MENKQIETIDNVEQLEISQETARCLGAKTLAAANFDARHKDIVESSFDKARKNNEKLPGRNNERRNYAYLSRLEKLIDKHGNEAEKKLWEASIKDDLLIDYDNITEAYWQSKRQELRDNGYGSVELTDDYKHELFNKERELQKESLEKWANYLGDEHSPYPLWFKVYAWDGMTKMGKYDKSKGKYATRNETTIAPYPNPDAEVLGKVFEVVSRFYGNNEKEFYTEEGERNIELEKVVQSGNFAKIYNAIEHDIAPIIEPPENPEDVHGQWIEYSLGEEDGIARAARGTGWCVASPSVGRHYLEHGTYGGDGEWGEERSESSLKSKFILFHLEDPSTGKLSKNAVASIRLDPDGQVAEISGLKDGQALNNSLVDTVAEKVKTLPGGEKFLEAFTDKQELIRLDRKTQNGEELTKEELEFIYEVNRKINTLDTYNREDPRIREIRDRCDIEYVLDGGIDVDCLVRTLSSVSLSENLDTLINRGADINNLISNLNSVGIIDNLDTLINHGADIDNLVSSLAKHRIIGNLDTLINHGADIDNLVSNLEPYSIAKNLDTLINHGANIDIDNLVSNLNNEEIAHSLDALISHGANIDIDNLVSNLDNEEIAYSLDALISHGANINNLVSKLDDEEIANNLDTLIDHGANIDIDNLVSNLYYHSIYRNINTLINHGADIDNLVSKLDDEVIVKNLDTLINHGANIDISNLVSNLESYEIAKNLDTLINHGADVNQLASRIEPFDMEEKYANILRAHGWQG